ncbi:MAG: hypothetical protein J3R72DRAFT_476007 [Linnemannia gamsii]|nr:MAG: hypothetical protein J3R72DRAFT_476007 [Linnemannia gamsii]
MVIRLSFQNKHIYGLRLYQGLRSPHSTHSSDIKLVCLYRKVPDNGDTVFLQCDVERHFSGYLRIQRNTEGGDMETVHASSMLVNIEENAIQEVAYPSHINQCLDVTQPGQTYQASSHEQTGHHGNNNHGDDEYVQSFDDPSGEKYSSSSPLSSSSSSSTSSRSFGNSSSNSSSPSSRSSGTSFNWEPTMINSLTPGIAKDLLLALFVVLPKDLSSLTNSSDLLGLAYGSAKAYSLCRNLHSETETTAHFSGLQGLVTKRPAEVFKTYTRPQLWNLRTFSRSLQGLKAGSQKDQEEYLRVTALLQADLGLTSADDVEPLVNKMIGFLQELLPQDDLMRQEHAIEPPPMSREEAAAMSLCLEPLSDEPQTGASHHGMIRSCDSRGREERMCPSCYHRLYPLYDAEYIKNYIGDQGEYDGKEGRIEFRPKDSECLQRLCRLDATKVGIVADLAISISWDPTPKDTQSIRTISASLGLSSLTLSSTDSARATVALDSSRLPLLPPSAELTRTQLDHLKRLTRVFIGELTHITVVSDEELDARGFLLDLQDLPPSSRIQVVTVNDPTSRYLAGLCEGKIHLLERESALADAPTALFEDDFNGKLQSITITNADWFSTDEGVLSLRDTVMKTVRTNPSLASLSLHCPAGKFLEAEEMMEILLAELASEQPRACRLATFTLVDNSEDHVSATFGLPHSRTTKSIVANVIVRNHGPGLNSFLDNYGPFIRVLNGSDKFGSDSIQAHHDSIRREGVSQLTDITVSLSDLEAESAGMLQETLLSSKPTLRHVVFVGAPPGLQVAQLLLSALNNSQVDLVVLLNDGSDMAQWIGQVRESLPVGSSSLVLDRVDDLCRIVPGRDDASLEWIKIRQARHVGVGVSSQEGSTESRSASVSLRDCFRKARDPVYGSLEPGSGLGELGCFLDYSGYVLWDDIKAKFEDQENFSWFTAPTADRTLLSSQRPAPNVCEPARPVIKDVSEVHKDTSNATSNPFRMLGYVEDEPSSYLQPSSADIILSRMDFTFLPSDVDSYTLCDFDLFEPTTLPLFIVLPESPTCKSKICPRVNLHVLCECDIHVEPDDQPVSILRQQQRRIHLLRHKGYEINLPIEFFKKYGPTILTVFQMLKHGVSSPGFDGPNPGRPKAPDRPEVMDKGLDHNSDASSPQRLKLFDVPLATGDGLDHVFDDLDARVDRSVAYIQSLLGPQDLLKPPDTKAIDEHQTPFDPVDLRQLTSFLKTNNEERTLGNLYRTISPEGYVKWVCHDHYRETQSAKAVQYIQAAVDDLGGDFNEFTESVRIKLELQDTAKGFYSALASSPTVQELDISFGWCLSDQDLCELRDAINSTKAFHVRLDGGNHAPPPIASRFSAGAYFDPLIQILSTSYLQFAELTGWKELLAGIETVLTRLHLRKLKIQSEDEHPQSLARLRSIVKACPLLSELTLDVGESEHVVEPMVEALEDERRTHALSLLVKSEHCLTSLVLVGNNDSSYKRPSFHLQVFDSVKTKLLDIPSVRTVHVQKTDELSSILARFDKCLKRNSGLDNVMIATSADDLHGWLKAFQDLFAKYPHQTPRLCVSNGHSTLTALNIQDHDWTESSPNPTNARNMSFFSNHGIDDDLEFNPFEDDKQDGRLDRELASSSPLNYLISHKPSN